VLLVLAEESHMQANKVKLVMIDRRGDFPLQDGLTSERAVTLQGGISPGAGCLVRRRVMGIWSAGELMLVLAWTRTHVVGSTYVQ
jgi:hypothetical protein